MQRRTREKEKTWRGDSNFTRVSHSFAAKASLDPETLTEGANRIIIYASSVQYITRSPSSPCVFIYLYSHRPVTQHARTSQWHSLHGSSHQSGDGDERDARSTILLHRFVRFIKIRSMPSPLPSIVLVVVDRYLPDRSPVLGRMLAGGLTSRMTLWPDRYIRLVSKRDETPFPYKGMRVRMCVCVCVYIYVCTRTPDGFLRSVI